MLASSLTFAAEYASERVHHALTRRDYLESLRRERCLLPLDARGVGRVDITFCGPPRICLVNDAPADGSTVIASLNKSSIDKGPTSLPGWSRRGGH